MKNPLITYAATLLLATNSWAGEQETKYPYSPSLIQWEKSSIDFEPPETCGECHPDKYEEWQGSMHSLAFQDPVYQGELNLAIKAVGHEVARQCEGCHTPAAMVQGEIKGAGLKGLSPLAMAGVSCDVCHSIKNHNHWQTPSHKPENGSFTLSPGRDSEEGPIPTKYGPFTPEEGCGEDFHECRESPLHLQAELCASCHQVFNYKTHTPIEETYSEWKNSPYAANNIQCQDCHMVEIDTFKRSADKMTRPERDEYRHYFNGANFLLYHLTELAAKKAGDEELAANANNKFQMAVARLQSAADLEVSPIYRNNRLAEIRVRIKNIRAGHNLPTSLTNVRQMWLEVTAKDQNGKTIMTTGSLDSKGKLPADIRLFNSDGQDHDLKFAIDPWLVESFSRHDTIPPKGYRDVHYGLDTDKGNPVAVEVKLRYRQADQKVAEKLLASVPDDIHLDAIYGITNVPVLPVIDMVHKTIIINK